MSVTPFNGLTPAEAERIAQVMEECGEVVAICGKILRHGWCPTDFVVDPPVEHDNRRMLQEELSDVYHRTLSMVQAGDVDRSVFLTDPIKSAKAKRYDHHQG